MVIAWGEEQNEAEVNQAESGVDPFLLLFPCDRVVIICDSAAVDEDEQWVRQ